MKDNKNIKKYRKKRKDVFKNNSERKELKLKPESKSYQSNLSYYISCQAMELRKFQLRTGLKA